MTAIYNKTIYIVVILCIVFAGYNSTVFAQGNTPPGLTIKIEKNQMFDIRLGLGLLYPVRPIDDKIIHQDFRLVFLDNKNSIWPVAGTNYGGYTYSNPETWNRNQGISINVIFLGIHLNQSNISENREVKLYSYENFPEDIQQKGLDNLCRLSTFYFTTKNSADTTSFSIKKLFKQLILERQTEQESGSLDDLTWGIAEDNPKDTLIPEFRRKYKFVPHSRFIFFLWNKHEFRELPDYFSGWNIYQEPLFPQLIVQKKDEIPAVYIDLTRDNINRDTIRDEMNKILNGVNCVRENSFLWITNGQRRSFGDYSKINEIYRGINTYEALNQNFSEEIQSYFQSVSEQYGKTQLNTSKVKFHLLLSGSSLWWIRNNSAQFESIIRRYRVNIENVFFYTEEPAIGILQQYPHVKVINDNN